MKNRNKITKFPVARIKRIMQKDEDVGKMSQATPIVISKALELFLAVVVDESAKVTAERGAKRVEGYHLKHAVNTIEMLDFLKEIVEPVADPSQGGKIAVEAKAGKARSRKDAAADDSDEPEPKKRRARRKKDKPPGEEPEKEKKKRRAPKKKAAPAPAAAEEAARESEMDYEDEDDGGGEVPASSSRAELTVDEDGDEDDDEGSTG